MLTPGEICSTNEPDKLFMVSYISQYYTTLKDRRPAGGKLVSCVNSCRPIYSIFPCTPLSKLVWSTRPNMCGSVLVFVFELAVQAMLIAP